MEQVPRPNETWVTDITYAPTAEGWLYLAGIKDLFTCEVVDHAMDAQMTADLVSGALAFAQQWGPSTAGGMRLQPMASTIDDRAKPSVFLTRTITEHALKLDPGVEFRNDQYQNQTTKTKHNGSCSRSLLTQPILIRSGNPAVASEDQSC